MKKEILFLGILTLLIAGILSPFASSLPDGLERVAENLGFLERSEEPIFKVIEDYTFPGIKSEFLSTSLAGLSGSIIIFFVTIFLFRKIKK